MPNTTSTPPWRFAVIFFLAIGLGVCVFFAGRYARPEMPLIPYFTTDVGRMRAPLPYRIVSFHRGRADKSLIKLASQLAFNGVQFQIEGSNEEGIEDFAARDARDHTIDYCHSLGMQVTVWVHELSDLPLEGTPGYLGPVSVDNDKLWAMLDERYEWILTKMIPKADGLVLTVVETQTRATDTPITQKLVELIDRHCRAHGKYLIVRTFVWYPEELAGVMAAVKDMPSDIIMMSKIVPQDWQMRGPFAAELGQVGGRPQIVEFDAAGEYFLHNAVANCMVDLLEKQFDYTLAQGAKGICVRVDRFDDSVLFEPNEVNLWALGMLSAGATLDKDEIWQKWATYRYGTAAAPAVIAALKPTGAVVAELLSVGSLTFGDTRQFPALPWQDFYNQNWQPWWWDNAYRSDYFAAVSGDPLFVEKLQKQKADALKVAQQCLVDLEAAKPLLPAREYEILHTRLISNAFQLELRTHIILAALHYRQIDEAKTSAQARAAVRLCLADIDAVQKLADTLPAAGEPRKLSYLGKTYILDEPLGISRDDLQTWIDTAESVKTILPQLAP